MDEPKAQPPVVPPAPRRSGVAVLVAALVLALVGNAWLILRGRPEEAPPRPRQDPRKLAARSLEEARSRRSAGAPDEEVLLLLDRAIDACPTLSEARLLRLDVALPRYLDRRAVLDASPLIDPARDLHDPEIARLREVMLSDAAALASAKVLEETSIEIAAIEAFLTGKPVPEGPSLWVHLLRAWRFLLDGRPNDAREAVEPVSGAEDAVLRWVMARADLAAARQDPARVGLRSEAKTILEEVPAASRTAGMWIDLAEADPPHEREHLAAALARAPGEPSILARLAEAEERAGAFAQALEWARQTTNAAPEEPGLLLLRARLHARRGQVTPARETYDAARRIAPDRADVLRARAAFLLRTGGADRALGDAERAFEIDRSEESLAVVCEALAANGQADVAARRVKAWTPLLAHACLCGARAIGRLGSLPAPVLEALGPVDRAFVTLADGEVEKAASWVGDPTDPEGWEALARVRAAQGRLAEVRDPIARALAADPLRAPCQALLGHALVALGRLDEARAAIDAAIEIDATCAEAWRAMGGLCVARGDLSGAQSALDEAVARGHGDAEGFALRAGVRRQMGMTDAAIEDLSEALRARPRHGPWVLLRGELRASRGDSKGALEDATEACEVLPDKVGPWTLLARVALDLGDTDACARAIDRALAIEPKHVALSVCRARLALARSKEDEARAALNLALSENPDDADALFLRARLDVESARWKEATDGLDRFLARHPSDPRAAQARGWLDLARKGLESR